MREHDGFCCAQSLDCLTLATRDPTTYSSEQGTLSREKWAWDDEKFDRHGTETTHRAKQL